jgi:hypothetical protein
LFIYDLIKNMYQQILSNQLFPICDTTNTQMEIIKNKKKIDKLCEFFIGIGLIFMIILNVIFCIHHINDKNFDLSVMLTFILMFFNVYLSITNCYVRLPNIWYVLTEIAYLHVSLIFECITFNILFQTIISVALLNGFFVISYLNFIMNDTILYIYFLGYIFFLIFTFNYYLFTIIHMIRINILKPNNVSTTYATMNNV